MTKIWPKDPVDRVFDDLMAYLRGEATLKRNLTNLAQPIAESVKFAKHDTSYSDMVRRMGEKPAAKFLADMSPLDAALWAHFQSTSLLKDIIKRWQTRRTIEDHAMLSHAETLEALHSWQQSVRQAQMDQSKKVMTHKTQFATDQALAQSENLANSNNKVLAERAVTAYKTNALLDDRLDGVRSRKASIAFFRQWLEDARRSAADNILLDRNEKLQIKLHELNLVLAAHESAIAYGSKPQVVSAASVSLNDDPTYRLPALNPYKRRG